MNTCTVMRMCPPRQEMHVRTQAGCSVKLLLCPSLTKTGRCPHIVPKKINVLNIILAIDTYRFTPQMSAETQTGHYVKCLSQLPDLNQNWCVCVCVCVDTQKNTTNKFLENMF